jgi:hypothetical protein
MNKTGDNEALVQVFAGTKWESELVKGLLESNGIRAIIQEGEMEAIIPNMITDENTVLVLESDGAAAIEILKNRE